jgi:hypothetical protein
MNWRDPSPEMLAALRLMRRAPFKGGMSAVQAAEWVMMAKESLWYLQAARWIESPPLGVDERSRPFFRAGCALLVEIVDLGYDADLDEWWPVRKLWPTDNDFMAPLLTLMDLGVMVKRLPNVGMRVRGYDGPVFPVVSSGFLVFVGLICGPRWEQRYESLLTATATARRFSRARKR